MAAIFKAKFGDKTFELDRLTLGDWRLLKRVFGLTPVDMVEGEGDEGRLKLQDPDVLVGILLCALTHEQPDRPVSVLLAEIDDLELQDFELVADDVEAEPDPQTAADDAATANKPKGKGRASGTPRKTSGSPR